MTLYTKPHLPVPEQLALLKTRGLIITDDSRAADALISRRLGARAILAAFANPSRGVNFTPD